MANQIVILVRDNPPEEVVLQQFKSLEDREECKVVILSEYVPQPDEYYQIAKRIIPIAKSPGTIFLAIDNRLPGINTFLAIVVAKLMSKRGGNRQSFRIIEVINSFYIRVLKIP